MNAGTGPPEKTSRHALIDIVMLCDGLNETDNSFMNTLVRIVESAPEIKSQSRAFISLLTIPRFRFRFHFLLVFDDNS